MEEGERPRKLQKIDHITTPSVEAGAVPVVQSILATCSEGPLQEENREEDAAKNDGVGLANSEAVITGEGDTTVPAPSKNQLKKLRRRERWEAGRAWRKEKDRKSVV